MNKLFKQQNFNKIIFYLLITFFTILSIQYLLLYFNTKEGYNNCPPIFHKFKNSCDTYYKKKVAAQRANDNLKQSIIDKEREIATNNNIDTKAVDEEHARLTQQMVKYKNSRGINDKN